MTTPGKDTLYILLTIALCCCLTSVALAEEEEEDKAWVQSAELSLVNTSGNSESTTFALKYTVSREWQKSRFKLNVAGLRAESDTGQRFAVGDSPDDFVIVDPSESEVTAENYGVNGRYERDVSKKFFWFLGGGWERNEFAGIDNRFVVEAGGGNTWFKTDKAHFQTSYSLTGTNQEDVVQGPGDDSETFLGVRFKSDYSNKLNKSTTYTNVLVVDENLDDTSDLRADLEQALAVSISDHLALKVVLQLLFDNQPSLEALPLLASDLTPTGDTVVAELDDLDTIFKTALVIDF